MPFCGFHTKMVTGLVIFAEGLFAATLERSKEKGIGIEEAYRQEVSELGVFLEELEGHYQRVKGTNGPSQRDTMSVVAEWVAEKDRKPPSP